MTAGYEPHDIRSWTGEDILLGVYAGAELWNSTTGYDPAGVLSDRQAVLLGRAADWISGDGRYRRRGGEDKVAPLRGWKASELVVTLRAAGILWQATGGADPYDVLSSVQRARLDRAALLVVTAEDWNRLDAWDQNRILAGNGRMTAPPGRSEPGELNTPSLTANDGRRNAAAERDPLMLLGPDIIHYAELLIRFHDHRVLSPGWQFWGHLADYLNRIMHLPGRPGRQNGSSWSEFNGAVSMAVGYIRDVSPATGEQKLDLLRRYFPPALPSPIDQNKEN